MYTASNHLKACPHCLNKVREDRLQRHINNKCPKNSHKTPTSQRTSIPQRSITSWKRSDKLLRPIHPFSGFWIYEQWLEPYQKAKYNKKTFLDWQDNMERLLQELADRLDLPTLIEQHLQGIEELIILPHIFLHLIPFAALPLPSSPRPQGEGPGVRVYLGDRFRIRILPSANILKYCHDRQNSPTAPNVAYNAYGSVEGTGDPSKDYAMTIARTLFDPVAQGLGIPYHQRLLDLQATCDRYYTLIKNPQVQAVHSIHHASAQLAAPLNSALHLADGDITLAQLMSYRWRMPQMQDIFLAGCETNLGNPSISDDILTLGAGFLCAGARSVVSTLWIVDAIATTVFCEFYYYERQLGHDRPTALHNAQVQLREQTITDLNRSLAVQAYVELLSQEIAEIKKTIAPLEAQKKELYADFKSKSKPDREKHPYRDLCNLTDQLSQKQKELKKWQSGGNDRPFASPYYWSAFTLQGLR